MSHRPQPSLADYVAIALSPALIMAMVGSLVVFILEVCYGGQYEGRMQWILFCFVFAAVLIARISMTAGISERAPLYSIGLGILVWFALTRFVEFPAGSALATYSWLINLGLIGLIWWSAHKLTWDCTYIDENVDSSGAGLLQVSGLERSSGAVDDSEPKEDEERDNGPEASSWWTRYQDYRERQAKRPHAPGVWVVYFSLAALPLFGLGQSLIPANANASRRYAFWLMAMYVASALGLLLTTSFLGLRRYLRQRKLQMPIAMTGVWLGIGFALIVVLLVAGALLPRPYAEYSLIPSFRKVGSVDRNASKISAGGGESGKGEGRAGSQGSNQGQGNASGKGEESGGQGKSGGESGSGKGENQNGTSQGRSQEGSSAGNQPGKGQDKPTRDSSGRQNPQSKPGGQSAREDPKNDSNHSGSSSSEATGFPPLRSLFSGLSTVVKWIVFILIGLIVAFLVVRAFLRFFANFTNWAQRLLASLQNLWNNLFGWWGTTSAQESVDEEPDEMVRPRPFASYQNPFNGGPGGSPEEIVRYSFEALEAWAWERGLGRQGDDTPLEFADRVGMETPKLAADACRLAALYARAAYGRGRLDSSCLDALRQFWHRLEAVETAGSPDFQETKGV